MLPEQAPFKEGVDQPMVETLAGILSRGDPDLDAAAFVAQAVDGLDRLALKARVAHVAAAVADHVHPDFPTAAERVVAGLPPAPVDASFAGLGFTCWPLCRWVSDRGLDHFDASMSALHAVTQRFSGEFAIRPFLEREPARTLAVCARWAVDPSPHVRRLASEGTRPLLPWGRRLRHFQQDPGHTLPLLEQLRDDPERYVQRSVANHLNDLAKDHPDRVVAVAERWLQDAPPGRIWTVKHGLRSLIKRGHPGALAALGYGSPQLSLVDFTVPATFRVGGKLALAAELRSTAPVDQRLVVDVVVGFRKARGQRSPKVFKWTVRTLPAGGVLRLTKGLPLRPVSTRRYYPGPHAVTLQVNGQALGTREFELSLAPE